MALGDAISGSFSPFPRQLGWMCSSDVLAAHDGAIMLDIEPAFQLIVPKAMAKAQASVTILFPAYRCLLDQ